METPTTTRTELFARVATLYGELGWSVPTCLEYANVSLLEESARIARHALATRGLVRHGIIAGVAATLATVAGPSVVDAASLPDCECPTVTVDYRPVSDTGPSSGVWTIQFEDGSHVVTEWALAEDSHRHPLW
jgi:hypothetical protein